MTDALLLSKEELKELTGGLTQGAAQIRWLRENGIEPYVGRDGRPRVPRAVIAGRASETPAVRPNFEVLNAAR